MASNINPSAWASWDLRARDKQFDTKMQNLLSQISQFAVQTQQQLTLLSSASGLANILNGPGLLLASAFSSKVIELGTITTDQTVAVAGAEFVYVRLESSVTQTRTLTLTNLPQGAHVQVQVSDSANVLTLKMAATDTGGNAYGITAWNTTNGAVTNMVSTGFTFAAATAYLLLGSSGYATSVTSPQLNFMLI